jgi:single-stranded-DNA-specific exonuclease
MGRMQSRPSRWECDPYEVDDALRLADGLGVSHPVAALLARRGFRTPEEASAFLDAEARHDPLTLPGAEAARDLIREHVRRGSRIVVFGDYDVDGVCSTTIMLRTLRALGADPAWELPSRFGEGYGLSTAAVERLRTAGADLLITVDCAITAVDEVAAARRAGLEVIVTDHHRPGETLPDCTVVHPALGDYGCPELCASGVALKLSEALRGEAAAEEDIDLAALATVCDLVPLRGENRRIVRQGLRELARTEKPGLRALMAVASVEPGRIDEQALGFRLGPRLNAAGRMQRADAALELLMTDSGERAEQIADELDLLNLDRREAETRIVFAADAACAEQADKAALVVAGEGWHPGVVGIVASRLVERWRRPCVVIALDGDAGRGSGRSIPAFDLHAGLGACGGHLLRFGGHRAAAGLDIARDEVDPFRRAFAAHAGELLAPEDLIPVERVDAVVPGGSLGLPLAEELETLKPFGMGNPQPTLLVPAARVEAVAGMGKDRQHARFTVVTAGSRSRGVAFGSPPRSIAGADSGPHDLALRLELNRWNGAVEPRVVLRAMCPTRGGELRVLGEEDGFWERVERAMAAATPAALAGRPPRDRRGEGFAGVAGDLISSGEPTLVAVADVSRRRDSLEELVAGLAPDGLPVASWGALAASPELAAGYAHVVALDPPPGGATDPILRTLDGLAHLAWGPAEAEFALGAYRWQLDLRPALTAAYRALRELPEGAPAAELEAALRGEGRHPREAEGCALLLGVLTELDLVDYTQAAAGGPACRVLAGVRTELERSATFVACAERLAAGERALAAELPERPAVAATAAAR